MKQNTEFLAAMFAAYMPCKVSVEGNPVLLAVNMSELEILLRYNDDEIWSEIENTCKLILTPLSEITKEDAIEVAKISGCKMEDAYESDSDRSFIEKDEWGDTVLHFWRSTSYETDESDVFPFTITDNGECYDYMGTSTNQIAVTDYLRSPKRPDGTDKPVYDCGFRNIKSLIAAGLAVKSEKK